MIRKINRSISISFFVFVIVLFVASIPLSTFAEITFGNVGGRIFSTYVPGVYCLGYGPVSIGSITAKGQYYIPYGIPTNSPPNIGGQFLGRYMNIPISGGCYAGATPPIPYPAFTIINYGTSKY